MVQIKLDSKLFDTAYNTIDVSCRRPGNIHIVCMAKRTVTKTIALGYLIGGMVYRDGYLIFCAESKGIQMVNIRNESVTNLVSSSISSNAYITSYGDYIYYTDMNKSSVTCCDLLGKPRWTFKEISVLPVPLGIAVDNEGNVYVADNSLGKVIVISPDGQKYRQVLSKDDGIALPWCITYDRTTDQLLVINWKDNAYLYKVTK